MVGRGRPWIKEKNEVVQATSVQKVFGLFGLLAFIGGIFFIYKAPICGIIALTAVFFIKTKMVNRIIGFVGFILFVLLFSGLAKETIDIADKIYSQYFSTYALFIEKGGIANFFSFFRRASIPQIFSFFVLQTVVKATIIFFVWRLVIYAFSVGQVKHKQARVDKKANFKKLAKIFYDKSVNAVPLGVRIDAGKGDTPVGILHKNLNKHVMLVGTTGSGKTVTLYNFIANALLQDKPIIFIDGKGDYSNIEKFENLCKQDVYGNKKPYVITIDGETGYNPLRTGTPQELADKLLTMMNFSDDHYEGGCRSYLLDLLTYMQLEKIEMHLVNIVKYLNIDAVINYHVTRNRAAMASTVAGRSPDSETPEASSGGLLGRPISTPASLSVKDLDEEGQIEDEVAERLESMKGIDKKAYSGLKDRLAPLTKGDSKKVFMVKNTISLDDIIARGDIILFSMDSLRYPDAARAFGRLVMNDLKACVSRHQRRGGGSVSVFIDEFNVFASKQVVDIINKSRSAGFEAVIAFQSLADIDALEDCDGKSVRRQIVQNCNSVIVQLQNDNEDADTLGSLFGTRRTIERTLQTQGGMASGMGSEKVVDEYVVNPNELKFLDVGEAWVKTSGDIIKIKVANFI